MSPRQIRRQRLVDDLVTVLFIVFVLALAAGVFD